MEGKEFSKKVVWLLIKHSVIWIYLSYLLALLNRVEIAQSLSIAVVTEIIAVIIVYCLKSLFENLSKHNDWPDKSSKKGGETDSDDNRNEYHI